MLCYVVLCCVYYIVLRCIVLCCVALCCVVLFCVLLCFALLYCCVVLYSAIEKTTHIDNSLRAHFVNRPTSCWKKQFNSILISQRYRIVSALTLNA